MSGIVTLHEPWQGQKRKLKLKMNGGREKAKTTLLGMMHEKLMVNSIFPVECCC